MCGSLSLAGGLALVIAAGAALAEDALMVDGQRITVTSDGLGSATLTVNGAALHENGVIYLDPEPQLVGGVTVITGSAGAGGNACNPSPFVVVLPENAAPQFWGPVESCSYFTPTLDGDRVVFTSDPVPGAPGETWVWTQGVGFAPGPAVGFAADAGWEALDRLQGAHPVDAMAIAPVLQQLTEALGADYPVFAERISDLGSGDLTSEGYLGQACLKFTCEADWAVLYLHRESRQVFAIWHVSGEVESHIWPKETTQWPPEAMAALRASASD
jgi:hypothetical protein